MPSSRNSFGTIPTNEGKVRRFSKHIEGKNANEAAADEQDGRSRNPQLRSSHPIMKDRVSRLAQVHQGLIIGACRRHETFTILCN